MPTLHDDGWVDAASIWPTMFDPTEIVDGRIEAYATHGHGDGDQLVGHYLIARDIGVSDNFEVSLRWPLSGGMSFVHQVSPVAFVDLHAENPIQMGVLPIWDVSIPATFIQNAFRSPVADSMRQQYYTLLGGGVGGSPVEDVNTVTLRSENGLLTYYWNGIQRGAPVPVPDWAEGRTWFGVHIIAADWVIGSEYPAGLGVATEHYPAVVDQWSVETITPAPTAPEQVSAPTVVGGDREATVTWTPPTSDGGAAVSGYVVTPSVEGVAQVPVAFSSTETTQVLTGLHNGTPYRFSVAAVNAVGAGPSSGLSEVVVPSSPQPGEPPDPLVTPGSVGASEGDDGSRILHLPVTLSAPHTEPVTIDYEGWPWTDPGHATEGVDYQAIVPGSLTFAPGETEKTVPVTVHGDTEVEEPLYLGEWAMVRFSNPSAGATIDTSFYGLGIVIIGDDD